MTSIPTTLQTPSAAARTDAAPTDAARTLRLRAWRWHFLSAVLVVPFVLWQSLTGTMYLWSQAWIDAQHAELRFVAPGPVATSVDAQLQAARDAMPGQRIAGVLLPAEPARSTQVTFADSGGLPAAVFVDPYRGRVLGVLHNADWLPGWSRMLHGGWPLGDAGSWLLELGACWTIIMVLTGLYLWWPRDARTPWQVLLPRINAGRRVFWRDLHACVAVWFSLAIVLFLLTALPWTSLWGTQVLGRVQRALDQEGPPATGFAPVFAGKSDTSQSASLDAMVQQARGAGVEGDLMLYMVDGPPGSAVSVRSLRARASTERYVLFDRVDGAVLATATWDDFPLLAKGVATGVDLHEGSFFGRAGPWVNTVFAAALVWLVVTGIAAWWRRRPARSVGIPPRPIGRWPAWLTACAIVMGLLLPLFGASLLVLWLAERSWRLFSFGAQR
ncbi:PepSY-associated TM helix domain-containing protein [Ahniella affigens]|nr:PepSY domain-containing protein [Ahniella affigens]